MEFVVSSFEEFINGLGPEPEAKGLYLEKEVESWGFYIMVIIWINHRGMVYTLDGDYERFGDPVRDAFVLPFAEANCISFNLN